MSLVGAGDREGGMMIQMLMVAMIMLIMTMTLIKTG